MYELTNMTIQLYVELCVVYNKCIKKTRKHLKLIVTRYERKGQYGRSCTRWTCCKCFLLKCCIKQLNYFFMFFAKFHIDLQLEVKTDEFETNIISQHFCIPSVTARPLPADEEFFVETFRLN